MNTRNTRLYRERIVEELVALAHLHGRIQAVWQAMHALTGEGEHDPRLYGRVAELVRREIDVRLDGERLLARKQKNLAWRRRR